MALSLQTKGILYSLLATVIWSGNFIVARGYSASIPPVTLAVLRWTCAALIVLPFGLKYARADWPVLRAHWRYYLLVSILGVATFNTLIYIAGRSTQAVNLSLISTAGSPIFIILLSRLFYGERIPVRRALGIGVVLLGVLLLISKGDLAALARLQFNVGDIWMLAATLCFATYSILMLHRPGRTHQLGVLTVTFWAGLLCGLLPVWAIEIALGAAIHPAWDWLPLGIYLGGGASLAAFFCWNKAMDYIGAAKAGIIYFTLPAFCGVEAVLFLGEPLLPVQFISAGLIILGILPATRGKA